MIKTHTAAYESSLCALFSAALFLLPIATEAFFDDSARADDMSFGAGSFEVEIDTDSATTDLGDSGTTSVSFETETISSLDAQYEITTEVETCDPVFHNGVTATVSHEDNERYSGPLSGLHATSSFEGVWEFELSASALLHAQDGDMCEITLTVNGWQMAFTKSDDGGFSDTKEVALIITADGDIGSQQTGTVVLNEIYPAPASTTTAPLEREWIELYNGTDDSVNVEGWLLGEEIGGNGSTTKHLISSSNTCSSGSEEGFARPYDNSSTIIPARGLLVIELCAQNRLHDGGDTVSLYSGTTSAPVDMHTYPETEDGKSHARIPDGSQWVDPVPTPGSANTATRDELRAEGWSESEIDRVLSILGVSETDINGKAQQEVPATTTASGTQETTTHNDAGGVSEQVDSSEQIAEHTVHSTTTGTTTSTTTSEQNEEIEKVHGTSTATTTSSETEEVDIEYADNDAPEPENDTKEDNTDETRSTSTEQNEDTESKNTDSKSDTDDESTKEEEDVKPAEETEESGTDEEDTTESAPDESTDGESASGAQKETT